MKEIFLLAGAFLCLAVTPALASKDKVNISSDTARETAYWEAKQEIAGYKRQHGKSLYVGEGSAEIDKDNDIDLGEATHIAKERAMVDMLSSIRVRVKSVLKDELKYSEAAGTSNRVDRLIESYVDQVVNVVQDKDYIDYPRQNNVTEIVYVSKDEYDELVTKDMQSKTDVITGYAVEGAKAQTARNIGQAIEDYINGKSWLKTYFEDLPVKGELKKDSPPEDLGSYFDTHLTQILSSIKMRNADENIVYNTEGKVSRKPRVLFTYEDASGTTPLTDMPAKASFAKGTGIISPVPLRTGKSGEIYVPVDRVDPGQREATVQVELDAAALRLKDNPAIPVVFIPVKKSKAVAWAVSFFRDGEREQPASLADSVKMALSSTGYELKPFNISEEEISDAVVAEARGLNVDYVVYACVTSSGQKDEYGMYKSDAASKVYIYSFYDDRLVEAIEGPSKAGYSTSAEGAANAALAKLKPGLIEALKEKIKTLK